MLRGGRSTRPSSCQSGLVSLVAVSAPVVVAEVVRSGFTEGHHHGPWSRSRRTGRWRGRSARSGAGAAPLVQQAGAGARDGAARPRPAAELLALACASHSGEPFHLEGVRRILAGPGSTRRRSRRRRTSRSTTRPGTRCVRAGGSPAPIAMNCSGKHAAMLATCVVQRLGHRDLPAPGPPAAAGDRRDLRRAHRRTGRGRRGRRVRRAAAVGVADRAGPRVPRARGRRPTAGARGWRTRSGPPGEGVGHPPRRAHAARAIPGAIGKAGAEACYAVALPDGRAFALKIDDGGARARPVVMADGAAARRRADRAGRRRRGRPTRAASCRCSVAVCRSGRSARSF